MTSLSSKNEPKIRMLYIASINDLIISLINRPKGRVKSIDTNFIVRIVDGSWSSLTQSSPTGHLLLLVSLACYATLIFNFFGSALTRTRHDLWKKVQLVKAKRNEREKPLYLRMLLSVHFSFFSENEDKCAQYQKKRKKQKRNKNRKNNNAKGPCSTCSTHFCQIYLT